ncbi:tetratricopeptide repeat protein [Wenyingzhuangia sp. IMCC45574]
MKIFKLLLLISFLFTVNTSAQVHWKKDSLHKKGDQLKYTAPDEALTFYFQSLKNCQVKNDTIGMIRNYTAISFIYRNNLDYTSAYIGYWNALMLAKNIPNDLATAKVNQHLGELYSYYSRNRDASIHLKKSLAIGKKIYNEKKVAYGYLISNYFSLANFCRRDKRYDDAKKYLDSCQTLHNRHFKNHINYFIETERAYHLGRENKFFLANRKLDSIYKYSQENNRTYFAIINNIAGEVYLKQKKFKKAENAFLKSIEVSDTYKVHKDHKVKSLKSLADLYLQQKQYKKAYSYLKQAKEYDDKTFNIKNFNNQKIFNISEEYRTTIEKQKEVIHKQKVVETVQKEKISQLNFIIIIAFAILVIVISFVIIKGIKIKHKREKQEISRNKEIEIQKQKDFLELKNKELTSSALRLIEKEEFIKKLNRKISVKDDKIDLTEIKRMVKREKSNNSNHWNEFEARFTKINKSFYTKLDETHPDLSQAERKLCALIKLKLTSKEMSSLMGVSNESVHTFRYRLRKKLGLDKDTNLIEYIDQI